MKPGQKRGKQTKTLLSLLGALHSSTFLGTALRQQWLTAVSADEDASPETGTELLLLPRRLAEGR